MATTTVPKSAAEQDAIRRAKKASQNANARARTNGRKGRKETLTDGIRADREERREEIKLAEAARQAAIREQQAKLAAESPVITSLRKGSTALVVALLVVEAFPAAEAFTDTTGRHQTCTDVAVEAMLRRLTADHAERIGAVELGVRIAHGALRAAYYQIKANAEAPVAATA